MSTHYPTPKGMPAVLAHYLPSTHDVQSLDDLSELFLTMRSRILAESNSREMAFIDQEKKLHADYDSTIAETESRLRSLQDELNQLIHRRESALRMLHSDRESYKSEVQTRLSCSAFGCVTNATTSRHERNKHYWPRQVEWGRRCYEPHTNAKQVYRHQAQVRHTLQAPPQDRQPQACA